MPDQLRGLIVDWGGVLTRDLGVAMQQWASADGVDGVQFRALMREWLGLDGGAEALYNPVHALERGEIEVPDFERRLAERLTMLDGSPVRAEGLLARMAAWYEHAPDMTGLVRRAHRAGIRTALLSNSWGTDYPRDGWAEMFDAVVISGEIGMRKPEPQIFQHALELLGLSAGECVFVDDLWPNVEAAVALGFVAVRHTSYETTAAELDILFDRTLST